MTMVHYETDTVSNIVRDQVLALYTPEMWAAATPRDAWNLIDRNRYDILNVAHIGDFTETNEWLTTMADRLSMPVFSVDFSVWSPIRAELMEWLEAEYARLGIGTPPAELKFLNRWEQRRRRIQTWRGTTYSATLHSSWDGTRLTRNIAALSLKTFN